MVTEVVTTDENRVLRGGWTEIRSQNWQVGIQPEWYASLMNESAMI